MTDYLVYENKKSRFVLRKMFHTQECRDNELSAPIKCYREDAWLGEAFYFWYDIFDAERWGNTSKRKTGSYEIYLAEIEIEDVLDTVFNEEHYLFWLKQIEKAAKKIIKLTNEKPTIKELNDYFKEKGGWGDVTGIMFQDLPTNINFLMIKPIEYRNKKQAFVYRKRIQLAVYNENVLKGFRLHKVEKCI